MVMIGERSRDLTTDESVELAARTNRSGDIGKSSLRIRLRKQIRIILGRTENLLLFNLLSALLRFRCFAFSSRIPCTIPEK